MVSRLLLLLTFLAVALIGDGVVRGAPLEKDDDCTARAYGLYDLFTKQGCSNKSSPEACERILFNGIIALNAALAICPPKEGYTLCRLIKPGSFSIMGGCTSTVQFDAIPKERCEEERKKDLIVNRQDGSQEIYPSSEAVCIATPYFRCHDLCK
ncbi:hypothetical protein [Parasitella parasitica]|uniref:Uncharacterized protein n=1 Tax=Parasitella parasitica TaxID=35722 RepID=A0A0B7N7U2_9FUNG|nr:hypothetical protein [Parasitella parasitica]